MLIQQLGLPEGIPALDLEVFEPVEVQIHAGDPRRGEVLLLPVEQERLRVVACELHGFDRLDEHAGGPAGRVAD